MDIPSQDIELFFPEQWCAPVSSEAEMRALIESSARTYDFGAVAFDLYEVADLDIRPVDDGSGDWCMWTGFSLSDWPSEPFEFSVTAVFKEEVPYYDIVVPTENHTFTYQVTISS